MRYGRFHWNGRAALLLAMAMSLVGCYGFRQVVEPVPVVWHQLGDESAHGLLVLLPGLGDRLGAFASAGFVSALADAGVAFDAVEVDAHIGYYRAGKLADTLHTDVVIPARQRGY